MTWQDGPAWQQTLPTERDEFEPSSFSASRVWGQPPAAIANLGHSVPSDFYSNKKLMNGFFAEQPIFQDSWDDFEDDNLCGFLTRECWHPGLVEYADP